MIRGIHHVALSVADLSKMTAFYHKAFGFELVGEEVSWKNDPLTDAITGLKDSAARTVMMKARNAYLELFQYSSPKPRNSSPLAASDRGFTHFCVDVTNIEDEMQRLTSLGMIFFSEKNADFGVVKAIYGKDPEGNIIELQETSGSSPFELATSP